MHYLNLKCDDFLEVWIWYVWTKCKYLYPRQAAFAFRLVELTIVIGAIESGKVLQSQSP